MPEKEITSIHQNLVKKAKQNDRPAQSQMYEFYFKAIFNSCHRIVTDSFVAEDIMHDSFIEAFKNIKQHNESATFGAWLKKIAINRSINHLKKEKLIANKLKDYTASEEVESKKEIKLSVQEIKMALTQLAPNYRSVFSLYLIEGYDHDEIGEIMNISASTSRSQLSRAKKQVRMLLEQPNYSTT
jgi:RNA polymerase sigma factor (sigma-70 family)